MADDTEDCSFSRQPLQRSGIHDKHPTHEQTKAKQCPENEDIPQNLTLASLPSIYLRLSKAKLTGLVAMSALCGYGMAPGELDLMVCFLMSLGTFMSSCSANAFNQIFEVPYDSQMARTKRRVLVTGLLSRVHAISFASIIGISGILILTSYVNLLAAIISATTWGLYVTTYTPLKRVCIGNTWIGAVVGALPPMIGWAGRTGSLDAGAFIMAGFLFTWQFPHFNALSWNLRSDYSKAGYRMMATRNPDLCQSVAFRHCLFIIVLSFLAPYFNLTTWPFALFSLPLNFTFAYLAWCFYKQADGKTATYLFKFSLLHLPLLMIMLLISKKNLPVAKVFENI
ncbi:protoheme IX farnesyltransferase, mitochondrial-like [Amphiura filiformis]|uniref:protoheme IX farnesyltransferase, mitochondrial-like n=1 Tax=Amphiura filiformis TaxID=82378 RepID=UPI003B219F41